MKGEEAKKLADGALEELALALEDGHSESLTRFLSVLGRFYRYSLRNTMLIAMARPDATHVAGYRTWQKLGRQVRQGEKGIAILAPMVRGPRERKRFSSEAAADDEDELGRTVVGFRGATVFDVAQTDGEPLAEFAQVTGDPSVHMGPLLDLARERGIRVEFSSQIGAAHGVSAGGRILLQPNMPPAETFSTLVHELAHERLHHNNGAVDKSRTIRETEAEAVAFVVCHAIGLEPGTASSDYIQLYDGTKETLLASLERIRTTAGEILTAIAGPPRQMAERVGADSHADGCVSGESPTKLIGCA